MEKIWEMMNLDKSSVLGSSHLMLAYRYYMVFYFIFYIFLLGNTIFEIRIWAWLL